MAINKGTNMVVSLYKGSARIGKVYKGSTLIYSAESDPVTLSCRVNQSGEYNSLNYSQTEYTITQDWDLLTVLSSSWGKSYGRFETAVYLVNSDNTTTTLAHKSGAYTGNPESVATEPILASGAEFAVKKGQKIRLVVGASYDANVSTPLVTTSSLTFKLT